jgi:hypothetical protein
VYLKAAMMLNQETKWGDSSSRHVRGSSGIKMDLTGQHTRHTRHTTHDTRHTFHINGPAKARGKEGRSTFRVRGRRRERRRGM